MALRRLPRAIILNFAGVYASDPRNENLGDCDVLAIISERSRASVEWIERKGWDGVMTFE